MRNLCVTFVRATVLLSLVAAVASLCGCDELQNQIDSLVSGTISVTDGTIMPAGDAATVSANGAPVASFVIAPDAGGSGLVTLDASASHDVDGEIASYNWVISDASGVYAMFVGRDGRLIDFTFDPGRQYSICLTVCDDQGASDTQGQSFALPALQVQPGRVDLAESLADAALEIANPGRSLLTFGVVVTYVIGPSGWLHVSPVEGTCEPGHHTIVQLSADRGSLPPGGCSAEVAVTAGTITRTVLISLAVVAAATSVDLIDFGSSSSTADFAVWNGGAGALQYEVTDEPSWLRVENPAGSSSGPEDRVIVRVRADRSDLVPGVYDGRLVVAPVATQSGSSKTINVTMTVMPTSGKTSSTTWQNMALPGQSGAFTAEFDAVANAANINGVTALSTSTISTYANCAIMVRFTNTGTIDARNGAAYDASTPISYVVNKNYHFRLAINVAAHTYSAYVTPAGGSEQTLASNFAFRTEQASVTSLANWGLQAGAGTHTVSNFQLVAGPLAAEAGANVTIAAGGSTTLAGSGSGGTAPYSFSWSSMTGLSSATVANPIASPGSTTTYTLTVRDAASKTASDSITVTVSASGGLGPTHYVSPSGNDGNAGTAASPWKTLGKAGSTAQAGATVIVKAGTYYEALNPGYSGASGKLITFKSETALGAILDGQNSRSSGVDLSAPRSYIRIEGFTIRNHTGNAVHIHDFYGTGGNYNQIVGCEILNNSEDAISCRNTVGTLVESCDIHDNGLTAVAMGGQYYSRDLVVRNNKIHHNVKDGIQGSGYNMLAEGNYFYDQFHTDAHQDAFDIETLDGATIRNNVISDFTQLIYGSLGNGPVNYWKDIKIYGNLFYNYRYWTVSGGTCPAINMGTAYTDHYLQNIEIFNNTFGYLGDGQKAITIYGAAGTRMDGLRIYNNIFYNCRGASGVAVDWTINATNLVVDYNCYYVVTPRAGYDTHSLQADPKFAGYSPASSWNFHLLSSSPCINTGDPSLSSHVTVPTPFLDMDGTSRPLGGRHDIGAYETQ